MNQLILPDRNARLAALETTQSCHVEAPAGSGKTYLLIARFLKLLGQVVHPREILALTFTKKAAGEMRSRIIDAFSRCEDIDTSGNPDDALLLNLARTALHKHVRHRPLLFSMDGLNIMTFHSFCYDLSKRAPLESSLPPDFNILEEEAQPLLIAETIDGLRRKIFRKHREDPVRQAFEKRLLFNNNQWNRLENEMRGIVLYRDRLGNLTHEVARHGLDGLPDVLRNRLGHHVEMFLRRLGDAFHGTAIGQNWAFFVRDIAQHATGDFSGLATAPPGASWDCLPLWQTIASLLLTKEGKPRKRFGQRGGFYSHFSDTPWSSMISELPRQTAALLHEARNYPLPMESIADLEDLKDLLLLSSALLSEYDERCRSRHAVDFTGLEQAALRALTGDPPADIQLYLDYRIRHLLVDEFQDTSLNQWILIQRLVSGWEPGDGRTVFLVGDPKQSIYGFRDAQVRLFLQAKNGIPSPGIGTIPVENLSLLANFRTTPVILDWINGLFGETVMSSPKEEYDEVPFGRSIAAGKKLHGTPSLSLHLFSFETAERSKTREAKWLAGCIREALIDNGSQTSIAVLLFNRNRLNYYLRALKEADVPVQVQEGLPLAERPEVRHLLQIARALTRPHDDLAWASILRSPWFWCDLETLYEVSLKEGGSWKERLLLAGSESPRFDNLLRPLDRSLQRTGRDSLGHVVKHFWESLDGPRVTASLYGMTGVANCIRLFDMMEQAETGIPLPTLNRLERMLDFFYEPPDPTLSRQVVQMMTVHRAKGLEFDTVFLPYLDWRPLASGPSIPPPYLLERLHGEEGDYLLALGPDSRRGETTALFRFLSALGKERSWGEAKRLFYVAATRAKTSLHMSAVMKSGTDVFTAADKSVLKWVLDHEELSNMRLDAFTHRSRPHLSVRVNPRPNDASSGKHPVVFPVPDPLPFEAEAIPYRIQYPSALETEKPLFSPETTSVGDHVASAEASAAGTVIHRLLSTCIQGGILPTPKAVSLALQSEGLPEDAALPLAGDILKEARDALDDPFISILMSQNKPLFRSEWNLDELAAPGTLRAGTIDLAVFDGQHWWIIDFKTSRPFRNESIEGFIARQENLHRSQMNAYRSMLSTLKETPLDDIHARIYFTFLRRWHDMK